MFLDEPKREFVRFDSATLDEELDVVSPLKLSGRITAASMNGAPRKVGKVVWPPVKEEAPKQEKQVLLQSMNEYHHSVILSARDYRLSSLVVIDRHTLGPLSFYFLRFQSP